MTEPTVNCSGCGSAVPTSQLMGSYCVECARKRRPDRVSGSSSPTPTGDGLFSEGFSGLLNKGPIGWMLFGLIGGILWAVFQALSGG